MPRLVPNPVGEIVQPLHRVEAAIAALAVEVAPVQSLPQIHEQLVEVNGGIAAILELLTALRADLKQLQPT
jgi:hypothetical protein